MFSKPLALILVSSFTLFAQVSDQYFPYQWNLSKISASAAWEISTGSPSIIIAILDGGVQSNHPDLDNHIVIGYDVVDNDYSTEPYGNNYHGTACAGIAAAETNNGTEGIAAVGYNCKIMPIQFTHANSWADSKKLANGIRKAADLGAHIINMSGYTVEDLEVDNAITYATSIGRNGKGCIIVKSSGSSGEEGITYPGKNPKVITVGATDVNDNRRFDSNYGPELDVMAPGGIYATDQTGSAGKVSGNYMSDFEGTSSAAPEVAGLAGLILSLNDNLTEEEVRKIICYSADDIGATGFDNETGWGRINCWRALDAINHKTVNGTLPRDEIWTGTVSLTGNVTVTNGVKLTILSTTTVNLNGHSIISTGGIITRESGVTMNGLRATLKNKYTLAIKGLYPTILAAINAATLDYIVEIPNGTFNENFEVYGKNNLSITGLSAVLTGTQSFYWCDNLTIYNGLTAKQINAYYCTHAWFYNDINGSPTQTGLGVNNCTNFYSSGDVYNCNKGINVYATSGSATGYIYDNNTSVSSLVSSNVQVSLAHLCESINYDFDVSYSGYISSVASYFGVLPPRVHNSGGTVSISSPMSCLQKSSANADEPDNYLPPQIQSEDPIEAEFLKINTSYFTLLKTIRENKENGKQDNEELKEQLFSNVEEFKNFIQKNPQSSLARVAFTTAANSFRLYENNTGMKNFLDEIIDDKELTSLKSAAENLMIDYYSYSIEFDKAISTADGFINNYKNDEELLCEGLLKKGLILSHQMQQPEKAIECFSAIVNNYPGNPVAEFAENELKVLGKDEEAIKKENLTTENLEFSTSSYPNPFNPITIINYSLPTDEKVVIKVYDILGREIAALVNEFKAAGQNSIQFDGSNLSSGIYFYRIEAGKFSQTKKIVLTK